MEEVNKNFGYFSRNEEERRKIKLRSARYAKILQSDETLIDEKKELKKLDPEERSRELLRRRRESDVKKFGFKSSSNVKKAKKLLKQSYRRVARHQRPVWFLNFVIAISLDFLVDIISMIPAVGWILGGICSFCGGLYLTISLWKTGNRKARTKKRVIRVATLILDAFPYIGILPLSTATVLIAYNDSKKESDQAKNTINDLQRRNPNLTTPYLQ